jgi:hypothetical protein
VHGEIGKRLRDAARTWFFTVGVAAGAPRSVQPVGQVVEQLRRYSASTLADSWQRGVRTDDLVAAVRA